MHEHLEALNTTRESNMFTHITRNWIVDLYIVMVRVLVYDLITVKVMD